MELEIDGKLFGQTFYSFEIMLPVLELLMMNPFESFEAEMDLFCHEPRVRHHPLRFASVVYLLSLTFSIHSQIEVRAIILPIQKVPLASQLLNLFNFICWTTFYSKA